LECKPADWLSAEVDWNFGNSLCDDHCDVSTVGHAEKRSCPVLPCVQVAAVAAAVLQLLLLLGSHSIRVPLPVKRARRLLHPSKAQATSTEASIHLI